MKAQSTGKNQYGFATLEILIAFAVVILCIGAVIMVSFGNQSVAVDSETSNEGVAKAQNALEAARAKAKSDFINVTTTNGTEASGPLTYTKNLNIVDITQCEKQATSNVSWTNGTRTQTVTVYSLLTDIVGALAVGGDCAVGPGSSSNWHNPKLLTHLIRGGFGSIDTNDADVENSIIYMANGSASSGKDDLTIEDGTNLTSTPPPFNSLIDGDSRDEGVSHYNFIDVARNNSSGKYYAYLYVGNDAATNQLQIVDVSDPNDIPHPPINPPVKVSFPPSTPTNGGGAVYFYKDKLYVGMGYNVSNPEIQIFNVSTPTSPIPVGSYNINHNVYKIIVRDQLIGGVNKTLAYVALSTSSGSPELVILDVTNPALITQLGVSSIFNPPGDQYGTSLDIIGNKAYLGRQHGSNPDFYVIDITDPTNPTSCASCHFNITGEDFRDLAISNNYAFIITDNALHILDVSEPSSIHTPTGSPNGIYSGDFTSIDLDQNKGLIYLTSPNQGNTTLYVIYPGP